MGDAEAAYCLLSNSGFFTFCQPIKMFEKQAQQGPQRAKNDSSSTIYALDLNFVAKSLRISTMPPELPSFSVASDY